MKIRACRVLGLCLLLFLASCNGQSHDESVSAPGKSSNAGSKITFIELGSVNCVPCRAMVPVMEQIEDELGDQVEIIFHDVWTAEGKPYGEQYKIRVIPTQIFLDREGNEYFRHEGYFSIEEAYLVLQQGGVELP